MDDLHIKDLELSRRAYNCLEKIGAVRLSQILPMTQNDFLSIKNLGAKTLSELLALQLKYKNLLGNEIIEIDEKEIKNAAELTLLENALPNLVGKEIREILFRNSSGSYVYDIPLKELPFSIRIHNSLSKIGIGTIKELAFSKYIKILETKNFGKTCISELNLYLSENTQIIINEAVSDVCVNRVFDKIERIFLEEINDFKISFFENAIKQNLLANKNWFNEYSDDVYDLYERNDFISRIFYSEGICKAMEDYILYVVSKSERALSIHILKSRIPAILRNSNSIYNFHRALLNLIDADKIETTINGYRIRLLNLDEWLDDLKNNFKNILIARFEGKSLAECGNCIGVTRERARQIIEKCLNQKPKLQEDDYSYWFENYEFDEESMCKIFNIEKRIYYYLTALYEPGKKSIESMVDDSFLTGDLYHRIKDYFNKDKIKADDTYIPCERGAICEYLAKKNCSISSIAITSFFDIYMKFLTVNNQDNNEKLVFCSVRAFEAYIVNQSFVLAKFGKKIRYYDIGSCDIENLVESLAFEQFHDVEISTLKLFREKQELMREYNIVDEYELHNLLKKTEKIWNKNNKYDVALSRMPFMAFGAIDRKKQTLEFLYKVAPVRLDMLAKLYELEYGTLCQTFIANNLQYVNLYYHAGIYEVDQEDLLPVEYEFMKNYLTEDFYFIDEVKKIFSAKFDEVACKRVNAKNLKNLGYRVFTNYIIKNTYNTSIDYFTQLFLKRNVLDLNLLNSKIFYINTANQALEVLRDKYDLIEFDDKKYIKFNHLVSVLPMINKNELCKFADNAINFSKQDFFTIGSLRKNGFSQYFRETGFNDRFYSAIIKQSQKVAYTRFCNDYVFCKIDCSSILSNFIKSILENRRSIDVYSLINILNNTYGLTISKDKLVYRLSRNNIMYYDSVMEKFYLSKDDYYNDIE